MEGFKIWLLTVGATIAYGIGHDLVTTRVSIEYFTIGHDPILPTADPTLTALTWGIAATWWIGVLSGLLFAFVARFGSPPKLAVRDLLLPGGVLIGCVAGAALLAGLAGFAAAELGQVSLGGRFAVEVPAEAHSRFLADAWAHRAAYAAGFFGNIALAVWIWLARAKAVQATPRPAPSLAPRASA